VNLPRVPVGSTLEGLFVEMWHGLSIKHRFYMSRRKMLLPLKIRGICPKHDNVLIGSTRSMGVTY
jgi:hypothetical protein